MLAGNPSDGLQSGAALLLIAGISVTAGFNRLLPKWIVVFGVLVAIVGELSWCEILFPKALPLITLTRFPGFIWMIAAGFALPSFQTRSEVKQE